MTINKTLVATVIAISFLFTTPTIAGELKGSAAIQAINGKNFSCKAGSLKFTLRFSKVDSNDSEFPFAFESNKEKVVNAYVMKKNGKFISKTGRQSRRIYTMDGGISIKASGRQTAKCVQM